MTLFILHTFVEKGRIPDVNIYPNPSYDHHGRIQFTRPPGVTRPQRVGGWNSYRKSTSAWFSTTNRLWIRGVERIRLWARAFKLPAGLGCRGRPWAWGLKACSHTATLSANLGCGRRPGQRNRFSHPAQREEQSGINSATDNAKEKTKHMQTQPSDVTDRSDSEMDSYSGVKYTPIVPSRPRSTTEQIRMTNSTVVKRAYGEQRQKLRL